LGDGGVVDVIEFFTNIEEEEEGGMSRRGSVLSLSLLWRGEVYIYDQHTHMRRGQSSISTIPKIAS
jgi:hypothetical protein